jgi:DNA-3-methyladenine glycosylase I
MNKSRCEWCLGNKLYENYHDTEWGVPTTKDEKLFELLTLESFQAGLSWLTILKKREHFRVAFMNFDLQKVAAFTQEEMNNLLQNERIIRHRGKIEAAVHNAKAYMQIQKDYNSFSSFVWNYVNHKPIQNKFEKLEDIPSQTEMSKKLSKDLKQYGFKFMGPTTTYAFMQASGLVNDHLTRCFRYEEVKKLSSHLNI